MFTFFLYASRCIVLPDPAFSHHLVSQSTAWTARVSLSLRSSCSAIAVSSSWTWRAHGVFRCLGLPSLSRCSLCFLSRVLREFVWAQQSRFNGLTCKKFLIVCNCSSMWDNLIRGPDGDWSLRGRGLDCTYLRHICTYLWKHCSFSSSTRLDRATI